ncbi:hypothetical protein niasHS_017058 [Heterodera schachtii]|uniref:Uncharacterized protein n=1 Tax=Heterodera schachtii TaxID=97005 RepID=A0ABD2HWU1_HETSC
MMKWVKKRAFKQQQLQTVAMLLKNGHTKKGPALNDPRGHPPVGQFIHSFVRPSVPAEDGQQNFISMATGQTAQDAITDRKESEEKADRKGGNTKMKSKAGRGGAEVGEETSANRRRNIGQNRNGGGTGGRGIGQGLLGHPN